MESSKPKASRTKKENAELSQDMRDAIIAALKNKESPTKLAAQFQVTRTTIYRTRKHYLEHRTTESSPRSGRSMKLSESDQRYICLLARREPGMTHEKLAKSVTPGTSVSTVKRVLRRFRAGGKVD